VWDGDPNQVDIFFQNAQVTYPILMLGGQAGIMAAYNCFQDYFFIVGGDGVIKWRGSWNLAAITTAIDEAIAELAATAVPDVPTSGHRLLANYPNPFNPQTRIPYEIAAGGPAVVRLEVLDVQGRLVKTLVQATLNGGESYEAVWDGTNEQGRAMPSGNYLSRLLVDGQPQARILTLVK
jgi:hypothetical protein